MTEWSPDFLGFCNAGLVTNQKLLEHYSSGGKLPRGTNIILINIFVYQAINSSVIQKK